MYVRGRGLVYEAPSAAYVHMPTRRVLLRGRAIGLDATELLVCNMHSASELRWPFAQGIASEPEILQQVLAFLLGRERRWYRRLKPRVTLAVSDHVGMNDRRLIQEACCAAGVHELVLIDSILAAGVGMGFSLTDPAPRCVVDIGSAATEAAIISAGRVLFRQSVRTGGNDLNTAIHQHMNHACKMAIGPQMAERIKITIGSAMQPADERSNFEVRGRDLVTGLPRKTVVTAAEIHDALREPLSRMLDAVTRTIQQADASVVAELADGGLTLCGGGALLAGLPQAISRATGLAVRVAPEAELCVLRGTAAWSRRSNSRPQFHGPFPPERQPITEPQSPSS